MMTMMQRTTAWCANLQRLDLNLGLIRHTPIFLNYFRGAEIDPIDAFPDPPRFSHVDSYLCGLRDTQ